MQKILSVFNLIFLFALQAKL